MKLCKTWFVIYWNYRIVFCGLTDIIGMDNLSENFFGICVFGIYRRTGETNE